MNHASDSLVRHDPVKKSSRSIASLRMSSHLRFSCEHCVTVHRPGQALELIGQPGDIAHRLT